MTALALIDPTQHAFWLISRSLGIVAMLLVSASVGLGLALSARIGSAPGAAARFKTLHEAISLASLAAIALHGAVLLGDPFLAPGLGGITLPFALGDQPIWTGLGIIAGWITAIIAGSFYVRRWIGAAVWRWLHRWTLLAFGLALVHTIGSGTDSRSAWLIAMLSIVLVPVLAIGVRRAIPGTPVRAPRTSSAQGARG